MTLTRRAASWGLAAISGLAAILLAAAGLVLAAAAPAAAAPPSGYGATGPAPSLPVGLVGTVVVTRTVGAEGGTLAATLDGRSLVASVPGRAGKAPLQITLGTVSAATVRNALDALGHRDLRVLTGVTLTVTQADGKPITGDLAKAITISVTGRDIGGAGQQLFVYSPQARMTTDGLSQGKASWSFRHSGALVVLEPQADAAGGVEGTTTVRSGGTPAAAGSALPQTGSDTAAYVQLGVELLAVGVALLVLARGRRRGRHARTSPGGAGGAGEQP